MTTATWLSQTRAAPLRPQQWWVLTTRLIVPSVQTGEVLTSAGISAQASAHEGIVAPMSTTVSAQRGVEPGPARDLTPGAVLPMNVPWSVP